MGKAVRPGVRARPGVKSFAAPAPTGRTELKALAGRRGQGSETNRARHLLRRFPSRRAVAANARRGPATQAPARPETQQQPVKPRQLRRQRPAPGPPRHGRPEAPPPSAETGGAHTRAACDSAGTRPTRAASARSRSAATDATADATFRHAEGTRAHSKPLPEATPPEEPKQDPRSTVRTGESVEIRPRASKHPPKSRRRTSRSRVRHLHPSRTDPCSAVGSHPLRTLRQRPNLWSTEIIRAGIVRRRGDVAMETPMIVALVAIVILAALVVAWVVVPERGSAPGPQSRFGDEYYRALKKTGDRKPSRGRSWSRAQQRMRTARDSPAFDRRSGPFRRRGGARRGRGFVDRPASARLPDAASLVQDVSARSRLPGRRFRAAGRRPASVNHPRFVENYRAANALAPRLRARRGLHGGPSGDPGALPSPLRGFARGSTSLNSN